MAGGPTYDVRHAASALESLLELDPSLQPAVNEVLRNLPTYVDRYPHRIHEAANGTHVYHHPNPDVEIAYKVDDGARLLTCVDVDAPLPRKMAFVSYCHRNRKCQEEFQRFMIGLLEQGRMQFWVDEEIEAGDDWEDELYRALHSAEAAVLLVTQDYLASDYIRKRELPVLRERYEAKTVGVYWLAYEHCTYEDAWFGKLQALYDPKVPLSDLRRAKRQKALTEISRTLKRRLVG